MAWIRRRPVNSGQPALAQQESVREQLIAVRDVINQTNDLADRLLTMAGHVNDPRK